ncbi:rhodanese-like domain-containing protein [Algoriphagus lutimaris]|uniref:rhodanese-like domain-containing protein n=1 Tax=Algoriphagus lutimaris TaxID=613197 RepID=UPI00196A6591|nr:rhodanese-like domain-containing protein [Algoriphagus lutimaris]MBN3519638.1 rhodanese-like domain-containing protein [Algoriphagus lutimaris]
MYNSPSPLSKKYREIASGEFQDLAIMSHTMVMDVRSAGEFEGGKIRGAFNLDVSSSNFMNLIQNLSKDKTYLIYCRSGNRSGMACAIMNEMGFKEVINLKQGLLLWPFELV